MSSVFSDLLRKPTRLPLTIRMAHLISTVQRERYGGPLSTPGVVCKKRYTRRIVSVLPVFEAPHRAMTVRCIAGLPLRIRQLPPSCNCTEDGQVDRLCTKRN